MSRIVSVKPRMEGGAIIVDIDTFTGTRLGTAVCGNQHSAYTGAHELAEGFEQALDVAMAAGVAIVTGTPLEVAKRMLETWYQDQLDRIAEAKAEAEKPAEPEEPAPNPATVEEELRAKVADLESRLAANTAATADDKPAPIPAPVAPAPTEPAPAPEPPKGDAA